METKFHEIKQDQRQHALVDLSSTKKEWGVSLDYILTITTGNEAYSADYQWFVMRVPYGKEREVGRAISSQTVFSYAPVRTTTRVHGGVREVREVSCVPNLLFVFAREQELEPLTQQPIKLPENPTWTPGQMRFVYDHTQRLANGRDRKMIIPRREMADFIRIMQQQDEHTRIYLAEQFTAKQGDLVEVIEGKFKGVQGHVARLHGQTCVLVGLQGLCFASTAYIPKAFLRKI